MVHGLSRNGHVHSGEPENRRLQEHKSWKYVLLDVPEGRVFEKLQPQYHHRVVEKHTEDNNKDLNKTREEETLWLVRKRERRRAGK